MLCSAIAGARLVCRGSTFATRQLHLVITPSWNGAIRKRMRTTGARSLLNRPRGGFYRSCEFFLDAKQIGFWPPHFCPCATPRSNQRSAKHPQRATDSASNRRGSKQRPESGQRAHSESDPQPTPNSAARAPTTPPRGAKEGCPSCNIMGRLLFVWPARTAWPSPPTRASASSNKR